MVTVRRHPIPIDSYSPDRPLNDLGQHQLEHFKQVAERLPEKLRINLPTAPSSEDAGAANRFIAAVTELLMALKRRPLRIVTRTTRKPLEADVAIAAGADVPSPKPKRKPARKPKGRSKSKPGSSSV